MKSSQLIARAEAALNTGQPNLAALYMRRAGEYLDSERATTKRAYRTARIKADPSMALLFAGHDVVDAINQFGQGVRETLRIIAPNLMRLAESTQADYTLAGPSKGGAA